MFTSCKKLLYPCAGFLSPTAYVSWGPLCTCFGYRFVTCRVSMALWHYLSLTAAKEEDDWHLVKFTAKTEKWRNREQNYVYSITQRVHDQAERMLPTSCPIPCPPEGTTLLWLLGMPSYLPSFATSQVYFPHHSCGGLHPLPHNLYLALKTRVRLTSTEIKGEARLPGPGKKEEETKRSFSVETAGKSLTLRSSERRRSSPDDDRVELKYKCFQISVARKQMTC